MLMRKIFAWMIALLFSVPVLVTLTNSFMTPFEINNRYNINVSPVSYFRTLYGFENINFADMALVPAWVSFQQYLALFFDNPAYFDHFWNSVLITVPAVLGQLLVSVPAAYAFEMSRWRHKEKLFFLYVIVMLMPLPVVLVPQFVMAGFLGISESRLAVIIPAVFNPFGVFLIRQLLKTMSTDFIEAAKIDGAGHFTILVSIIVPLLKPAIAALAVLVFIDYWNVVEQAIVFIPDAGRLPLSVALSGFNAEIIFAASVFYMLPALLIFLYGQEYLTEGRFYGL